MEDILASGLESGSAIGHDTFTLGGSNLAAQVGLARLAELALSTLGSVQGNDVIANLDIGHTLADALDDTSTLVSENDGESTLRISTRQGVGVSVADTGEGELDADLMGTGRQNLDILNRQRLAGLPGNGSLTGDGLSFSRHD